MARLPVNIKVNVSAQDVASPRLWMARPREDRIDWRAVIVNALALAYVLFCGLMVAWWLA